MMTKARVGEWDRLVSGTIADCQYYGLAENHVLEFWRGAKLIVDELKMEAGTQCKRDEQSARNELRTHFNEESYPPPSLP
ncbi:MAG TPA: hypothetical protein ENI94_10135 [Gammaproteobacteria bacterium]|nr:hypothetical protein [Gammaproteobacteria bacterium]